MRNPWWLFFFWSPLMAIIMVGIYLFYCINIWTYSGKDIVFSVKSGEHFSSINYRLKKSNLIYSATIFHRYAQIKNLMTKFKTGSYKIKNDSNMNNIFNILINGKPITIKVTIPEGKNLFEIAKILDSKKITSAKDFIKTSKDRVFIKSLKLPGFRTEGYLYPETYNFSPDSSSKDIIKIMVNEFNKKTKNLNFSNQTLSKHQIIILASVVEKETGAKHERPLIAGVFLNRLKKRMRLQSDPTTIYGIYETYNGNLRKKDLLKKTPYNTYKISSLPIGPISNPGIESIKAVLRPAKHNSLYFVSQNDGTHIFTETYKDHLKAVKFYQQNRKNRQGKSWRDLKQ